MKLTSALKITNSKALATWRVATQKALTELASEQRDDVLQVMATELVQMRAPRQPKPAAAE
ncbi:MAG: hypothetical protein NTV22_04955 [bacterium]|nr:hypothetical protein [bacterium]